MSKYTTEVRFICEMAAGLEQSGDFLAIDDVLEKAVPKVFDFDWPIFDEAYRFNLEKKILRHFYTREIGEETVGLWKLRLQTRLCEIMPYYNQLYKSELLKIDPFANVDYTKTHQGSGQVVNKNTTVNSGNVGSTSKTIVNNSDSRETHSTGKTGNTVDDTKKNYVSETPQGNIQDPDATGYLSRIDKDVDNSISQGTSEGNVAENGTNQGTTTTENSGTSGGNSSNNGTADSTDQYIEHIRGTIGNSNYSKLLDDFRKTFLNIDAQVIDDLECLFFMLW